MYTVFAGGDDFFLIGPWHSSQRLAARMRDEFSRYAAGNPEIHFSAGIATQKPGAPVGAFAELADEALESAKEHPGKNAVTCFNETIAWRDWPSVEQALAALERLKTQQELSKGYIYRLLYFVDLREREEKGCFEAAIWRSQFKYATQRYIVDKRRGLREPDQQQLFMRIAQEIGDAIEKLQSRYRVVLFNYLYAIRGR